MWGLTINVNELHLFAGAGGGILGGMLLGHTCVCAVEIEPYPRQVLLQRQRDGILPRFPIWDDVRTFDGKPWRGLVGVVCAGIPCQKVSGAGQGDEFGFIGTDYYEAFKRIVREIRPPELFVENSPVLTLRGAGQFFRDLAEMGYDAKWGVLGAAASGLPHNRLRIWIAAHAAGVRLQRGVNHQEPRSPSPVETLRVRDVWMEEAKREIYREDARASGRMAAIRAGGNIQIPAVAALAWRILSDPS